MIRLSQLLFTLGILALSVPQAYAVIETYEFDSELEAERYHQFIEELRCPKCQNQNLSGSNSPIAEDLRRELYRMLQDGKSDQQIVDFMVERYGDFILYRPRFNPETALLWLSPIIFLLLGLFVMFSVYRRQRSTAAVDQETSLEVAEQEKLEQILSAAHAETASHDSGADDDSKDSSGNSPGKKSAKSINTKKKVKPNA